jgi:hypothetical protein
MDKAKVVRDAQLHPYKITCPINDAEAFERLCINGELNILEKLVFGQRREGRVRLRLIPEHR